MTGLQRRHPQHAFMPLCCAKPGIAKISAILPTGSGCAEERLAVMQVGSRIDQAGGDGQGAYDMLL